MDVGGILAFGSNVVYGIVDTSCAFRILDSCTQGLDFFGKLIQLEFQDSSGLLSRILMLCAQCTYSVFASIICCDAVVIHA